MTKTRALAAELRISQMQIPVRQIITLENMPVFGRDAGAERKPQSYSEQVKSFFGK